MARARAEQLEMIVGTEKKINRGMRKRVIMVTIPFVKKISIMIAGMRNAQAASNIRVFDESLWLRWAEANPPKKRPM